MKLLYKAVSAEINNPESKKEVKDLLNKISEGWEIISAVGVSGGVHYILLKETDDRGDAVVRIDTNLTSAN